MKKSLSEYARTAQARLRRILDRRAMPASPPPRRAPTTRDRDADISSRAMLDEGGPLRSND